MLVKLQPPVGFLLEPLMIFAGSSIFDFAAYARIWGGDRRRLLCVLLHRFFCWNQQSILLQPAAAELEPARFILFLTFGEGAFLLEL